MLDTLLLVLASIKDVLLSQRSAQTALQVRPDLAVGTKIFGENPRNLGPMMSEDQDAMNGATDDGNDGNVDFSRSKHQFSENLEKIINPNATPRLRKLMKTLIRNLHDFCRDNEITMDEYMTAIQMINAAGRMSDHHLNEGKPLTDILGAESSVGAMTPKPTGQAAGACTDRDCPPGPFLMEG